MPPAQSKFDPAYLGNITYLYDQSDLLEDADFKLASEDEKRRMLENEFYSRKNGYYADILWANAWYLMPAIAFTGYKFFRSRLAPNPAAVANPPPAGGVLQFAGNGLVAATLLQPLTYMLLGPITREIEKCWHAASRIISANIHTIKSSVFTSPVKHVFNDEIEKLEHQYILQKRNISSTLWGSAEAAIGKARNRENMMGMMPGMPQGGAVDVATFLQMILSLPNNVRALTFDKDLISTTFSGYDLSSPDALAEFCFRFVSASKKNSPVSKIPLYFYGPAGVGKTKAARKLAKVLDVAIGEVSLEKVVSINDLIGWPKESPNAYPGLIAEAILKTNKDGKASRNMLLLFDESDRMINRMKDGNSNELVPMLLKLLEPKTKSFYSPYFEAEIDISHVGFIFVGNSALNDKALQNRMQPIEFKGFRPGYKIDYIRNTYVPQLLNEDFSDAELSIVASEITAMDWAIIETMINEDKDPGFRTIFLNVRRFLEHKALNKQFKRDFGEFKAIEYDEQDRF